MKSKIIAPKEEHQLKSYVPLYDMLCEIVHAIKDDFEATPQMKALARRGRKILDAAK